MLIVQIAKKKKSRHQMFINSCLATLIQTETFTKLNLIIDIINKDRIFKYDIQAPPPSLSLSLSSFWDQVMLEGILQ